MPIKTSKSIENLLDIPSTKSTDSTTTRESVPTLATQTSLPNLKIVGFSPFLSLTSAHRFPFPLKPRKKQPTPDDSYNIAESYISIEGTNDSNTLQRRQQRQQTLAPPEVNRTTIVLDDVTSIESSSDPTPIFTFEGGESPGGSTAVDDLPSLVARGKAIQHMSGSHTDFGSST